MSSCWAAERHGTWVPRQHEPRYIYAPMTHAADILLDADLHRKNSSCMLLLPHMPRSQECFQSSTRYEWQPENRSRLRIPVTELDRARFCNIMGRRGLRSLAFIGDSVTKDQAVSLWRLLGVEISPAEHVQSRTSRIPCGERHQGNITVAYRVVQILDQSSIELAVSTIAWSDVSVINVGAHYSERKLSSKESNYSVDHGSFDGAFRNDLTAFALALKEATHAYRFDMSAKIVIWRSTPMGHAQCMERSGQDCKWGSQGRPRCASIRMPGSEVDLEAEERRAQNDSVVASFGWHHFALHDATARTLLTSAIGARYLDVTAMSLPRVDAHTGMRHGMGRLPPDCLHWSLPGVPDYWNALLLGALSHCE
mmetsp:Transcript_31273/g.81700  ORF Transcript_31273/g.81700 Transcript_31273/m.81700 type:complete len:367 (-) Transcript_31273:185-1285(-)